MGLELIQAMIRTSMILACVCAIPLGMYEGAAASLGLVAGACWGALNLHFTRQLILKVLMVDTKDYVAIFTQLLLKFPVLYGAGYWLLSASELPFYSTVTGSLFIFIALFWHSLRGTAARTALFFLALLSSAPAFASLDTDVPEVPNIFTLVHKMFQSPWSAFLHGWENVIFAAIIGLVIFVVFFLAARKRELIPSGLQNFVEWTVDLLRKFILDVLGKEGEKYVPLLGTLFIYILGMNWLALIPFMKPPTSSINITIALALVVFIQVQYLNFKNWGLRGFLFHLAGSPKDALGWAMVPLMFPIEILTQLTRPITLALRLFGNIVGEDILIGAAALFGVYLLSSFDVIGGIPMQLPFMLLAMLTGLMQALVFTLLSTIYILLSMPNPEEGH